MSEEGNRRDVYQDVTDRIVFSIEQGANKFDTFELPWYRGGVTQRRPTNARTGNRYRGINVIGLWAAALANDFGSGFWATYKQWRDVDAQVRKGEKASLVVFYKTSEKEVVDKETGERETETRFVARASWVFNEHQVDGWAAPELPKADEVESLGRAEALVASTRADIRHGGDMAYYHPLRDCIHLPDRERFTGTEKCTATEGYYATLLHELTHWTAHRERVGRDLTGRFGDKAYAMEELVAELGAAFLCADLGVTNMPREDHAAYIAGWLEVLKHDKRAIFTAASKAEEATKYLIGQNGEADGTENASAH